MVMPLKYAPGWYVYVVCYPNGRPFYVGAGTRERVRPIVGGRSAEYLKIIREIRSRGKDVKIVAERCADKAEAHRKETEWILRYGRKDLGTGYLINRTGGLGSRGREWTNEQRENISVAQRGRKWSVERKKIHSQRMMGNTRLLGYIHSPETRAKLSAVGKGRKLNLSNEERQRRADRIRERNLGGVS